jgi:hypothetical protein
VLTDTYDCSSSACQYIWPLLKLISDKKPCKCTWTKYLERNHITFYVHKKENKINFICGLIYLVVQVFKSNAAWGVIKPTKHLQIHCDCVRNQVISSMAGTFFDSCSMVWCRYVAYKTIKILRKHMAYIQYRLKNTIVGLIKNKEAFSLSTPSSSSATRPIYLPRLPQPTREASNSSDPRIVA